MATDKQDKNKKRGRWKKGESGNPNGRPKKEDSISELVRVKLAEISKWDTDHKKTNQDMIIDRAMAKAIGGDLPSAIWLFDRAFGKSTEVVKQTINFDEIVMNE